MTPLLVLWTMAVSVAAVGTWVLFDGAWGINAAVWTVTAAVGLLLCVRRSGGSISAPLGVALGLAVLLAAGTAVTTDAVFHGWIILAVLVLFAIGTRLAADGRADGMGAVFMASAPGVAVGRGLVEVERRVTESIASLSTNRSRPWVRGAVIALPVVVLFALLLADADPLFAAIRHSLRETLADWNFLPRVGFFATLLTAALGAGGLALRGATPAVYPLRRVTHRLGLTERLIVLVAVTLLFAVFLFLQLSYLFGNAPAVSGSGVTFAEYARRGFNELTIVATLCALLVIALDGRARGGDGERAVRVVAIALVAETLLLLVSAFRRVWLYETAYGFTTTRLYAQAYMILIASTLALLAWEIERGLDPKRLARGAAALAGLTFASLIYWNHEAWIVRVNVARACGTGTLDATYLVRGLSPDALPALVEAQASAPEALALPLRQALRERYGSVRVRPCFWFEVNVRQRQAVRALERAGLGTDTRPLRDGCVTLETVTARGGGP
jgi:hypothetical protein